MIIKTADCDVWLPFIACFCLRGFILLLSFYSKNFKCLARVFPCIDSFSSDLVKNSEDRFSHDMVRIKHIVNIMFMPKCILPHECVVNVEIVLSL